MRLRVKPRFLVFWIVVMLLAFGTNLLLMRGRYAQGEANLRQARRNRDELILQVNALTDQLNFARTDDYVIRIARDELGMIMPGEVRYVNGAR